MSKSLKVVFLGTPDFAVASLKAIHESPHSVLAVVTMPDKPMGRGRVLQGSAVKEYALENGLPCLQPEKLKDPKFLLDLQTLKADIFVVVAFRMLPEMVWDMPPMGTINVHASLLPQYRGAAPINWAIINGEKETGVTVFRLRHEIDTGDILLRKSIAISMEDSAGSIHDKLMDLGATALIEALDKLASGNVEYLPQLEDSNLKKAPKIYKDTCKIDWNSSVNSIYNFIRGLSPYPGAWTIIKRNNEEVTLKILASEIIEDSKSTIGQLKTDGKSYLHIGAGDGWISALDVQISGKKRMKIEELLRGYHIEADHVN
jgi:methionyl-tRNA formyltransferase